MSTVGGARARVRGASVGSSSALVTVAAHTAGGAGLPSPTALLLVAAVCAGFGVVSAAPGRQQTASALTQVMGLLAVAQAFGHVMLTAVDAHHHSSILTPRMLTGHLLAVVLGALVVRGAERGIGRAVSALKRVVPRLVRSIVDTDAVTPDPPVYRTPAAREAQDLSGRATRGPPALV